MILGFQLHTLMRENISASLYFIPGSATTWESDKSLGRHVLAAAMSADKTVKAVVYVVMEVLLEGIEKTRNCRGIILITFFGRWCQ